MGLAITGMLFAEVWHPMLYAPSNVPAIFAFQGTLQQSSILAPVLLAIGAVETASFANLEGLSPWTKDKLSAEDYRRKEVVELNNGRLAMLACIGLWAQELVQHGQPVMFTLLEKVATYEIPALFQEFHQ